MNRTIGLIGLVSLPLSLLGVFGCGSSSSAGDATGPTGAGGGAAGTTSVGGSAGTTSAGGSAGTTSVGGAAGKSAGGAAGAPAAGGAAGAPAAGGAAGTMAGGGAAGTSAMGGSGGGAASMACVTYCDAIMSACTAGDQQYTNKANCLNSCKAIPPGMMGDKSGNTLACRTYHSGLAAMAGNAKTHCPHAGPGGDGVCGSNCEGYCQIATMYCTDANMAKVYDSSMACMTDCATRKTDIKYNIAIDAGNEVACLLYHVQEASSAPVDHCLGDLAATSMQCK